MNDDWYSAHQVSRQNLTYKTSQTAPYFLADEPASVVGCKLQYQVCDPTKSPDEGCSAFGGGYDITSFDAPPRTQREKARTWALNFYEISDVVKILGPSSLTSRFRMVDHVMGPLPANQWQLEVENWHNIALSSFQANAVISAAGPGDPGMLEYFWTRPSNSLGKYLCQSQVCLSVSLACVSVQEARCID